MIGRLRGMAARAGTAAALLASTVSGDGLEAVLEGEQAFRARTLHALLPEKPERISRQTAQYWAEDAAYEVENYYRRRGYLRAEVRPRIQGSGADWEAILRIEEGPRYRYGAVRVLLAEDSTAEFPDALQAQAGEPYAEEDLAQDERQIVRHYGNAGFIRVRTESETLRRDSLLAVDVTYRVRRGPAAVFDTLILDVRRAPPADTLAGLTDEDILRSLVPYERGDTIRIRSNDRLQSKLQSTALYTSVRLEDTLFAPGEDGVEDVGSEPGAEGGTDASGTARRGGLILSLEERPPGRAQTSIFFETRYGFGVTARVTHDNVAGRIKGGRAGVEFAQNKQGFSAGFGFPLLFGQQLRFDNHVQVDWLQDKLPDAPLFGGDFRAANTASLSRALTRWLRLVASLNLDYLSQLALDTASGTLRRETLGSLNAANTAFISFVDMEINPRRGLRYAFTWGNVGPVSSWRRLGDRNNWIEAKSAYYYYLPPWDWLVGALRLDAGRFFGIGAQNADRFFLGGPRNVRSYGYAQLCPDAPPPEEGSCPIRQGALEPAYILASAEMRLSPFDFSTFSGGFIRNFRPLEVVPFADYGKVWNLSGEERLSLSPDFLASGHGRGVAWGAGLRYPLLGIFNFRVDLAWGRPDGGTIPFMGRAGNAWPDAWVVDLAQAF